MSRAPVEFFLGQGGHDGDNSDPKDHSDSDISDSDDGFYSWDEILDMLRSLIRAVSAMDMDSGDVLRIRRRSGRGKRKRKHRVKSAPSKQRLEAGSGGDNDAKSDDSVASTDEQRQDTMMSSTHRAR